MLGVCEVCGVYVYKEQHEGPCECEECMRDEGCEEPGDGRDSRNWEATV